MRERQQWRYENECKLVADARALQLAGAVLDATCLPDPKYAIGTIHSIYLDTPTLRLYDEKSNGDLLKRKVRLRWYDKPDPPGALWVEVKLRLGAGRDKHRLRTTANLSALNSCDLETSLPAETLYRAIDNWPHAHLVPHALIPLIHISYQRRRWLCPATGSRVSLDWQIQAPRINRDLLPYNGTPHLNLAVCEFKNATGRKPPWLENLTLIGFRYCSFSKYGTCLEAATTGANRYE